MEAVVWTKDLPTEPGFYWCHQFGRTRMVSVWRYSGKPYSGLFTNEDGGSPLMDSNMYKDAEWNGPIKPPVYA